MGLIWQECKYKKEQNKHKRMCDRRYALKREEPFEMKTKCNNYKRVSEENESSDRIQGQKKSATVSGYMVIWSYIQTIQVRNIIYMSIGVIPNILLTKRQ